MLKAQLNFVLSAHQEEYLLSLQISVLIKMYYDTKIIDNIRKTKTKSFQRLQLLKGINTTVNFSENQNFFFFFFCPLTQPFQSYIKYNIKGELWGVVKFEMIKEFDLAMHTIVRQYTGNSKFKCILLDIRF